MNESHRVALIGFTAYERTTLEAFFRLSARRSPHYVHVAEPAAADAVLVDADLGSAVDEAMPHVRKCVFVGTKALPGALGHMARPLNMMALLKLLDQLLAAPASPTPAAAPARPAPQSLSAASVASKPASAPAPTLAERRSAPRVGADELATSLLGVRPTAAAPAPQPLQPPKTASISELLDRSIVAGRVLVNRADHILVVDDSDVALRFMANCLGRFGFEVQLAKSGEEALQRVSEDHFAFVFMDVNMPGIDGYQTCKLIKKRPYPEGRSAPAVVMLTSRGGMVDKMRGTLAGCDAYLTKPLQHTELMTVIGERLTKSGAGVRMAAERPLPQVR
jgi:two-component system, cell cycle response regulator